MTAPNNGKISKNFQNSRSPCFFSWIRKSYPSITKITQYLLFTVLCYLFPKKDKQNLTSVLSFFVFSKEETQKTKNEIRLPFYRFSFYVQTNTKKGKTKNDFRFIVFPFMYKQTQKKEKPKMTSVLSFFLLCTRKQKNGKTKIDFRFLYEQTQKTENDKWLPFYRFSFYVLKQTKTYKRKLTSVLSFFFVSTTNQCKKELDIT